MMLYCNLIEIREAIFPMSACREKRDGASVSGGQV